MSHAGRVDKLEPDLDGLMPGRDIGPQVNTLPGPLTCCLDLRLALMILLYACCAPAAVRAAGQSDSVSCAHAAFPPPCLSLPFPAFLSPSVPVCLSLYVYLSPLLPLCPCYLYKWQYIDCIDYTGHQGGGGGGGGSCIIIARCESSSHRPQTCTLKKITLYK